MYLSQLEMSFCSSKTKTRSIFQYLSRFLAEPPFRCVCCHFDWQQRIIMKWGWNNATSAQRRERKRESTVQWVRRIYCSKWNWLFATIIFTISRSDDDQEVFKMGRALFVNLYQMNEEKQEAGVREWLSTRVTAVERRGISIINLGVSQNCLTWWISAWIFLLMLLMLNPASPFKVIYNLHYLRMMTLFTHCSSTVKLKSTVQKKRQFCTCVHVVRAILETGACFSANHRWSSDDLSLYIR